MRKTRAKKNIITIFQMIIVSVIFVASLAFCSYVESHYSIKGRVYQVEDNIVTFEDKTGNLWDAITDEDLTKGQEVKIYFYNNHTDNTRFDDELINYKVIDKDKK